MPTKLFNGYPVTLQTTLPLITSSVSTENVHICTRKIGTLRWCKWFPNKEYYHIPILNELYLYIVHISCLVSKEQQQ